MAITRDRYGRPMIVPPEGGPKTAYTRATTIAGTLDDGFGLGQWRQRLIVQGLVQRPDLMAKASSLKADDTKGLNGLVETALEAAGASKAATIGTAVHAMTEKLDRGEDLGFILDDYKPDLMAYEEAIKPFEIVHIEQMTVQDDYKIAGTPDRIVKFEGEQYIWDLKTGSVDYPHHMATQLSIYSRSKPYNTETNTRFDWGSINQDRGIIAHLPAGSGKITLYWVDLNMGWDSLALAMSVREWRKAKKVITKI